MRDRKPQLKQIGLAYFNFLKHKLYKYKQHSIVLNDRILETIIEKIAINENTLLKTIQFNFDVQLAFDYLEPIIRMYFVKESYYSLTKMILFDIYRTHIILLYDPISILMAALFLCSQIMNQMPVYYQSNILVQRSSFCNTIGLINSNWKMNSQHSKPGLKMSTKTNKTLLTIPISMESIYPEKTSIWTQSQKSSEHSTSSSSSILTLKKTLVNLNIAT